jgi:predicted AAA+ superfamily ATPase
MKLVKRLLSKKLSKYLKLFPVVAIIGHWQAGRTTFAKMELTENGLKNVCEVGETLRGCPLPG